MYFSIILVLGTRGKVIRKNNRLNTVSCVVFGELSQNPQANLTIARSKKRLEDWLNLPMLTMASQSTRLTPGSSC
jgi:hypothetical protein